MDFDLYALVKHAVLPPGLLAVIGMLGLGVLPFARRTGLGLLALGALGAWVLGMPLTASLLAAPLERAPPFSPALIEGLEVDAIVVLGGGQYQHAPEFGGDSEVSRLTLERLRYAARVHRATGLPLAVSGGYPVGGRQSEAALMRESLESDFQVPVRWAEDGSVNTAENAILTRRAFGFATVVLVTHAAHMRRARHAFEEAGMTVVPAPLGFISGRGEGLVFSDLLPTRDGFLGTRYALYEYFGAVWYWLHYGRVEVP